MSTKSVLDSPVVSTVIFVALLVGITAAWHYLPVHLAAGIETVERQGAYGDRYGSVNALFTGLAFAALLFTILLQQRELKLQREDIANQMQEMKLSRDEVHRQVILLERQNRLNLATLRLITHKYYKRAAGEQKADLARITEELRPKNTLADFEMFVESSPWTKRHIDMREIWVCDVDNTFQIIEGDDSRDFTERWTTVYPDRSGSASPVYLKVGAAVIKELTFVSMDGRRIFVPMAEVRPAEDGNSEYFWNLNGLEVKVCRIIGSYYTYNDLV